MQTCHCEVNRVVFERHKLTVLSDVSRLIIKSAAIQPHDQAFPGSWRRVCVCVRGGGACCSKCGWLYESPSEMGGALLVKYLSTCARSVTTVNSSRVKSAQVKNPVCVFIYKNRKKEQHSWPSELCSPVQQQQQLSLPPSTRLSFYF